VIYAIAALAATGSGPRLGYRHAKGRGSDTEGMTDLYVALGDSMSIDAYAGGPGRGAASLLWRNRDDDFPDRAGRELAVAGFEFRMLARDGATSADVVVNQVPAIEEAPTLVTLTMGGNDLLLAYGDDARAEATIAQVLTTASTVLTRLAAVTAEGGRIVLTTVYDPSDGTGVLPGSGLPEWQRGSGHVRALNAGLADLANRYGAVLADVHARFLGHGVDAGDPAQPEARPANRDQWYCGIIEPNAWGADAIRMAWWQALTDSGWAVVADLPGS
jgi:lysophospholipase L1-like esterase